eukprot:TRINITY_DN6639_c0_g1_i1.p1 TRINITY_DN6639_c0_g1~~TRINITY_DN6639_c0_g1_i1.p1  ORF type:complete len:146 (-),score=42.37 TRINITY_DN6639_c0_g1_i1:410-847(-)
MINDPLFIEFDFLSPEPKMEALLETDLKLHSELKENDLERDFVAKKPGLNHIKTKERESCYSSLEIYRKERKEIQREREELMELRKELTEKSEELKKKQEIIEKMERRKQAFEAEEKKNLELDERMREKLKRKRLQEKNQILANF